jgi:hypothetical protein
MNQENSTLHGKLTIRSLETLLGDQLETWSWKSPQPPSRDDGPPENSPMHGGAWQNVLETTPPLTQSYPILSGQAAGTAPDTGHRLGLALGVFQYDGV